MTGPETRDDSGIRFPPPLVYALFFLAGYGLHRLEPVALVGGTWPSPVGMGMIAVGVLLAVSAVATFRRAGTNVNPTKPATTVVTHGPFRFTRNPMYVSMALIYLGGMLMLDSVWPLVFFPATIWVIRTRIIALEEAYLEGKFGAAYLEYKKKVRRWL